MIKQIDFIVTVHMLQYGGDALEAHSGVDAGRRQRQQGAVGLPVELHEYIVPDLDEAVTVFIRRTGRTAGDMVAMIEKNLGAGPAGAGIGHLPEVIRRKRRALVVTDADDARFR